MLPARRRWGSSCPFSTIQNTEKKRNSLTLIDFVLVCRYAASTEEMGFSLPKLTLPRHSPLPDFASASFKAAAGTATGTGLGMGRSSITSDAGPSAAGSPSKAGGSPTGGKEGAGAHKHGPAEAMRRWARLLSKKHEGEGEWEGGGAGGRMESAWQRQWRARQEAAAAAPAEERFTVLFPEVVK